MLMALDLSAAFDTIDHSVFLSHLESCIGVKDIALQWFRSYVADRSQAVFLDGVTSRSSLLLYGVPQGSVTGPFKFIIYTSPVHDISHNNGYVMVESVNCFNG